MADRKTVVRFFSIADYDNEEQWLREQHQQGWKLKSAHSCIYTFEKCEPEDVIYRLDFTNNSENPDYIQMIKDYGWEYAAKTVGWLYFRKPAAETENENDGELFSDAASKYERITKIEKQRFWPIIVIFLCCVIPNVCRAAEGEFHIAFAAIWVVLLLLYIYIIVHTFRKLRRLKKELE